MKPVRVLVFQAPRNPTERDREILTLLAEGHTQKQAAGHLGLAHRSVTNALGRMRRVARLLILPQKAQGRQPPKAAAPFPFAHPGHLRSLPDSPARLNSSRGAAK